MAGHAVSLRGFSGILGGIPGCAGKRGVIGPDTGKIKGLARGIQVGNPLPTKEAIVNPDFTPKWEDGGCAGTLP